MGKNTKNTKITKDIVKKTYTDPVTGKFIKGNPGGGRPEGSINFRTKFEIFLNKLAKQNNMEPQEIDEQLFAVAYKKAKEGDYQFWKDVHDRIYGKPLQVQEITNSDGNLKTIIINKYGGDNQSST